jgi:hypothetical protein
MFEQLFGSKTRVKLLHLFYSNPNRAFYVREITRKIDEQINSVRRELSNLLSIGIIVSDANNNRLSYEVNQEYQHYKAFTMIFGGGAPAPVAEAPAKKEDGTAEETPTPAPAPAPIQDAVPEHPLARELRQAGRIELALLTGQFTRDERSGIDLLIVGDTSASKVDKFVDDLQKAEGKEVRYTVMTLPNYKYRAQIKDRFISNILNSKKQVIINNNDLLSEGA